jgi:Uma2 family endonuclease
MIATTQDLMVLTEENFNRLPEDGIFEVVDGRAILLPGNDIPHQDLLMALYHSFHSQLVGGAGFVIPQANVFIPRPPDALGELQNRVPDLVVSTHKPKDRFRPGRPPELVIEILTTRRGNVERTEKMDDYARAGIGEYWIVNPVDRVFEVYYLQDGDYVLQKPTGLLRPRVFPDVEIDPEQIWAVLAD